MNKPETQFGGSLEPIGSACHGFDGQCADSWCNCDGYELAASHCKGDIAKVMKLMRCSYSIAKRVCDWYAQNDRGQARRDNI